MSRQLTIEIDDDLAAGLARLAAAASTDPEEYLARMVATLVQGQSLDGHTATDVLCGIPGAVERITERSEQARRGEFTLIDEV